MKLIKYAIVLLMILATCSVSVEAKRNNRRESEAAARRRRDREREKYREWVKKQAEIRKKRIAEAEARQQEQRDKDAEAQKKKIEEQIAAEKAAQEEKALLGEYDIMAREVRMTSTQRQKLVNMIRGFKGLPVDKIRDNSGEIERLTKLLKTARGQKKKIIAARLKKAKEAADAPQAGAKGAKLTKADQHRKIMGLLTPAQKQKWGGYKLARDPALKFEDIELNDKQVKRIRAICDAAAKGLPDEAVETDPDAAAKKRENIVKMARIQTIFEVLTPAQRTAVGR